MHIFRTRRFKNRILKLVLPLFSHCRYSCCSGFIIDYHVRGSAAGILSPVFQHHWHSSVLPNTQNETHCHQHCQVPGSHNCTLQMVCDSISHIYVPHFSCHIFCCVICWPGCLHHHFMYCRRSCYICSCDQHHAEV